MNTFNFSYKPPDESKYVAEKNLIRGCMRYTPTIFVSTWGRETVVARAF